MGRAVPIHRTARLSQMFPLRTVPSRILITGPLMPIMNTFMPSMNTFMPIMNALIPIIRTLIPISVRLFRISVALFRLSAPYPYSDYPYPYSDYPYLRRAQVVPAAEVLFPPTARRLRLASSFLMQPAFPLTHTVVPTESHLHPFRPDPAPTDDALSHRC